jgi:hypothetical protein
VGFGAVQQQNELQQAQARPADQPAPKPTRWQRWQAWVYRWSDKLL